MGKSKKFRFSATKQEFETDIWPKLEFELREEMDEQATPPGGSSTPAGGTSMTFDSLTAVCVVEGVLAKHFDQTPSAEKVIREGGYDSIDDFIRDIRPRLLVLCQETKDQSKRASEQ